MNYLNPRTFLLAGGIVLLLVGILGHVGPIGPTHEASLFGMMWWFDMYENIAHTVLGIAALIAVYVLNASMQRTLVVLVGCIALFFALYSGLYQSNFYGAQLQQHADTILHFVVAAWAFLSAKRA